MEIYNLLVAAEPDRFKKMINPASVRAGDWCVNRKDRLVLAEEIVIVDLWDDELFQEEVRARQKAQRERKRTLRQKVPAEEGLSEGEIR